MFAVYGDFESVELVKSFGRVRTMAYVRYTKVRLWCRACRLVQYLTCKPWTLLVSRSLQLQPLSSNHLARNRPKEMKVLRKLSS